MYIDNTPFKALLDTGCTKSCIKQGSKFPTNSRIFKNNLKLVCANNEIIDVENSVSLKTKIGSTEYSHDFVIVPKLSAEIILGLDFMKDFSFVNKENFVKLNGEKIPLFDKILSEPGRAFYSQKTKLNTVYPIKVKNPFFGDKSIKNVCVDRIKLKNHSKFQANFCVYKNEEFLNVLINSSKKQIGCVRRNQTICIIEPIELNDQINGIKFVDNEQEIKDLENFQKTRLEKFGVPKNIDFGSYGDQLSESQKEQISNLAKNKHLAFARNSGDLGQLPFYRFTLPMIDESKTSYQPERKIPPALEEKVAQEVQKFKDLGIIEQTQSGFNIPLIILQKSDSTIRISLDARDLNMKLVPDRYPLPLMSTILQKVGNRLSKGSGCYITTLDINKAFWSLRVHEKDKHKFAFSHNNKHYCTNRMLYGCTNSPSAWARVVNDIFDHPDLFLYLDDFLLISSTFEEHLTALEYIFEKSINYGLTLSPKKIHFCSENIVFLGHKIDKNGVKPTDKHIEAIKNYIIPENRDQLKRFCGMANFNCKFVKDASTTLAPLHKLTSNKVLFEWTEECTEAFENFKKDLIQTKGLAHYNTSLPLYLTSDASLNRCGATLYQIKNNEFQPIGYYSKVFSNAEKRASARHRELYALVYAIRNFEYYLLGREFNSIVDHKSLLYLFREHSKTQLNSRLFNSLVYLQNHQMRLYHYPGNSNEMVSADALSRLPVSDLEKLEAESQKESIPDKIFTILHQPLRSEKIFTAPERILLRKYAAAPINNPQTNKETENPIVLKFADQIYKKDDIFVAQSKCKFAANIGQKLKTKSNKIVSKYEKIDSLIYRKTQNGTKLLLPYELSIELLSYLHHLYIHIGTKKLMEIAKKHVFIPKLLEKAKIITKNCLTCISTKPMKKLNPSQVKHHHFDCIPFSKCAMDLYDLGKPDTKNKRYLLTIIDHLTGFLDGIPLSAKNDNQVSLALTELILRHGISNATLISDNGLEFGGQKVAEILKSFNIRHSLTSAYSSQSNGICERMNREIKIKQQLLDVKRKDWSYSWLFIKFILNNTPKDSLDGLTSSEAYYGRALYNPFAIEIPKTTDIEPYTKNVSNYLNEVLPALEKFHLDRQNRCLNPILENNPIKLGDYALIWMPKIVDGKLSKLWHGPFKVIKHYSRTSYLLKDPLTKTTYKRSLRHLRPLGRHLSTHLQEKFKDLESENLENTIENRDNSDKNEDAYSDFENLPFFN